MSNEHPITFVFCVESGWLEAQAIRLIESFRQFSGKYRDAPVIAVTPRLGAPLARATRDTFARHQVRHIVDRTPRKYSWFNYYNKPVALVAAERHVETPFVAFLDSDLFFVSEPEYLLPSDDEDLLAFPVEIKEMGTSGIGDPFYGMWRASCAVAGIDLEQLPWITTAQSHERIRLYFNSGVFVYRKAVGFADEYLRLCTELLDSQIGTHAKGYGLGFKEQASVVLATMTLGLRYRILPYSHNYPMTSQTHAEWYRLDALQSACIVHYHDAMWPPFWDTFLGCVRDAHPPAAVLLERMGPMRSTAAFTARALSRVLKAARNRQQRRYLASCAIY